MQTSMDLSTAIDLIEGMAECEDDDLMIEAWQSLIDEGHVWRLQGFCGRTAVALIEVGVCKLAPKETSMTSSSTITTDA